ncbi:uncharacterized protein LOC101460461 isoform X1 [Ceratitis capitata]|uniref:uncharacterized protein LOC101460461 isoform X1 n=1 Tax=Ceratitis capitata TaxID=7213 RepID=UPI000A0F9D8F|nr:uncharacterized protein LOC101460461 isoform X1 [Ceratitis capitata]
MSTATRSRGTRPAITAEFGAQTTASIREVKVGGTDFAMQTTPSLEGKEAKATPVVESSKELRQPVLTVDRGTGDEDSISQIYLSGLSAGETPSSASAAHYYDKETDNEMVARVKKLTKLRNLIPHTPSLDSSNLFIRREVASQDENQRCYDEASLESQAYKQFMFSPSGSLTYGGDEPNGNNNTVRLTGDLRQPNEPHEMEAQESDAEMAERPATAPPAGSASSSLSSEPYLQSAFATNLQLGDGFLYMVIPPDGGYGWFIMVISFFCQVIVDGIIFSVGILLPHMARGLGETQTTIVLVASVQVGCYFLAGSVASAFINKYGFRVVALLGGICSIVFIMIGTFSNNLAMLIFFYSVLGGTSLSLIWVSSQLIIGYYFERYRPIANGLSCSGAGAGILIFSFMNAQICPDIGWRNTSRIHTALLLLILLMGMTFIEVTPTRIATVKRDESSSSSSEDNSSAPFNEVRYSRFQESISIKTTSIDRGLEQMLEVYEPQKMHHIERMCPCCCRKKRLTRSRTPDEQADTGDEALEGDVEDLQQPKRYLVRVDPIEREDLFYTGAAEYDSDGAVKTRRTANHLISFKSERAKTVKYSLSVVRSQRQYPDAKRRTIAELRNRHKNPYWVFISPRNWMPAKLLNAFARLFDMNMLKIIEFRILLLSAFFFTMGFNIPFVYSKIRAEVDPFNASLISPTIGLSNLIFRIASGFAANKYRSQTTYMCGGGIVFGGIATLVSAFYGEDVVWFQYTYAACYGVAPAFFSTLRAIIYVRTLGLERLTNAFGLTGLGMGLGVFLGTTTAAILNGLTHRYNAAFAFSGVCLITSGVLKVILPSFLRYRARIVLEQEAKGQTENKVNK